MFTGTPVPNVGDPFENSDFRRGSGLHELNNIDLKVVPGRSDGKTHRPGGFSNPLAIVNMKEAEALFLYESGSFLGIKNR